MVIINPPLYKRVLAPREIEAVSIMRNRFFEFFSQIKIEIPVLIKDYSSLFENEGYLFSDWTHLNYQGAERFTDIINKEIIES